MARNQKYLVDFIPFGVDVLFDDLALEELFANLDDPIWVRLALDQPSQELVLANQFLSLKEVNPQDALWSRDRGEAL